MFISPKNTSENCNYCGTKLNPDLWCPNSECKSHDFSVGNRITLPARPDYGFGYIDDILDFQTPYEFCADEELPDNVDETERNGSENKASSLDLFYERPMYRVRFKLYISKTLPAEDMRHDIFDVGENVRTKHGLGQIEQINIDQSINRITYDVKFEEQTVKTLAENEIVERLYDPIESLINFRYTDPEKFTLNYIGKKIHNTYSSNTIKFITNSRLSLMPHQVYVAHELIEQYMPRYILADEVGLGKTIEAGIFLKEMISRNLAKKILIVVPANLVDQWVFEFENKFSINLTRFDKEFADNLDRCSHPNVLYRTDPGKTYPFVITSMQFARRAKYREMLTSLYWDYVLFDEAHHLRRYIQNSGSYRETLAYTLAKKLSAKTQSLLLLTATPIQLHSFDLFSLLQLIRPDIFRNYEDFEIERKRIPLINSLIRQLSNFYHLNQFQRTNIIDLLSSILSQPPLVSQAVESFYNSFAEDDYDDVLNFDVLDDIKQKYSEELRHVRDLIEENIIEPNREKTYSRKAIEKVIETEKGRIRIVQQLKKYHFLSHFMFRNRKRKVFADKFNKRIVKNVKVRLTDEEFNLYNHIRLYLAKTYNQAMDSKNTALGFVMVILQKLLTSSPPALISSLEKRIEKIKDYIEEQGWTGKADYYSDQFDIEEDDWEDFADIQYIALDSQRMIKQEQKEKEMNLKHLNILEEFLGNLRELKTDSKIDQLTKLVKSINSKEMHKIIIFTQFMKTLYYIQENLEKIGLDVSVFHGSLSREEKNQNVEYFKKQGDVLVSTEAGGEGRNFQFSNVIVNYDLPWNPMKLEQRIGRLDRIGQQRDIYIYNFTTAGTIESRILDILTKRIKLFEESIGDLEPIVKNIEKSINKTVFYENDMMDSAYEFDEVIEKNQDNMEEIQAQLDDLILDTRSFQYNRIKKVIPKSQSLISHDDLKIFIETFLTSNIIDNNSAGELASEKYENGITQYTVKINDQTQKLLNLDEKLFKGVFKLDHAQQAELLDFYALGHPLINQAAEYCRNDNFTNPSGVLSLNLEYLLSEFGPKMDQKEKNALIKAGKGGLDLWIIILESEQHGLIIEKQAFPVVISENGFILERVSEGISKPSIFKKAIRFEQPKIDMLKLKIGGLSRKRIERMVKQAKSHIKDLLGNQKRELKNYNEIMFKKELQRRVSLFEYKQHYIQEKIKRYNLQIEKLKKKKPTKRQWLNLEKIEDKTRKKKKEIKFKNIEKRMQQLYREIDELEKERDNMEFDLPADIKRLEFYRKLRRRIWLSQIALVQ